MDNALDYMQSECDNIERVDLLMKALTYAVSKGYSRNSIIELMGPELKDDANYLLNVVERRLETMITKTCKMKTDDLYFVDDELANQLIDNPDNQFVGRPMPMLQQVSVAVTEQLLLSGRADNVINSCKM